MKAVLLAMSFLISTAAMAEVSIPRMPQTKPGSNYGIPRLPSVGNGGSQYGIPRGEREQSLAVELVQVTGLSKDRRVIQALTACAQNDKETAQYLQEIVAYFTSKEFNSQRSNKKQEEVTMARIEIKMTCAKEFNKLGVDL